MSLCKSKSIIRRILAMALFGALSMVTAGCEESLTAGSFDDPALDDDWAESDDTLAEQAPDEPDDEVTEEEIPEEEVEDTPANIGRTAVTDPQGSCVDSCGGKSTDCWCDIHCNLYGDCCNDVCDLCSLAGYCWPGHPDYETDSDIRDDVPVPVPYTASGEAGERELINHGPFEVSRGEKLLVNLYNNGVGSQATYLYVLLGGPVTSINGMGTPTTQEALWRGYTRVWFPGNAELTHYWIAVRGSGEPINPYTIEICLDNDADGICNEADQCHGDDASGDADGDGVCEDVDLCLGDDSLGDDDLDGVCDDPPTIVEDFEAGAWPWAPWVETGTTYAVRTAPEGAHDGNLGLELAEIPTYRTDVSFGLVENEVLAAWVQPGMAGEGRIELGFDAGPAGGYMLRLDSYTDALSFRFNNFAGSDSELAMTTANVEPGVWYLLEIQAGSNGQFEGRVLASDGDTLVANLFHTFTGLSGTGIALNGNMNNRLDTIHTYLSVGSCSDSDGDGVCDTDDICFGDDAWGDSDADGVCEDLDICIGYDWLGDADADGHCDHHVCAGDVPPYYDQSVSAASWTAGGTCVEFAGLPGPTVCTAIDHQQYLADIDWILTGYPWTNAVFDAQSGNNQNWPYSPYSLLCSNLPPMHDQQYVFDDLNDCYFGHTAWNGAFDSAHINFDWGVNVWKLVADYQTRAATYGGNCALSGLGGVGTGFHVSDQGGGARQWTVHATDNCDFYGCRCDATVEIQTNPIAEPGVYIEVSLTNQSTFTLYEGMLCEDPLFDF